MRLFNILFVCWEWQVLMAELCRHKLLGEAVIFARLAQALDDLRTPDEHDIEAGVLYFLPFLKI